MLDAELHITANQKDGLMNDISQLVISRDFTLTGLRLGKTADNSYLLRLSVRGEADALPALASQLSDHPLVLSCKRMEQQSPQHHPPSSNTLPPQIAHPQVEAVLPSIAQDYPKIFPRLIGLGKSLSPDLHDATLHYTGRRVGVWVYKRDFALGGKLGVNEAIKRIALPALKQMLPAQISDSGLQIDSNPLQQPGNARNGHFFCGFLEGLLEEACSVSEIRVNEHPDTGDASRCRFEISSNCAITG